VREACCIDTNQRASACTGISVLMALWLEAPPHEAKSVSTRGKASVRAHTLNVHEEDPIDGCDVEFLESEATPDAELPAAIGGMENDEPRKAPLWFDAHDESGRAKTGRSGDDF
jgi:hypothetical protein